MTEPLEGAMLPNDAAEAEAQRADEPQNIPHMGESVTNAPPTWPDLAYWRDLANHREAMLAIRAGEIDALRQELETRARDVIALQLELEIARKLIAEMRAPVESTRAAVAKALIPWRALNVRSAPEIWR